MNAREMLRASLLTGVVAASMGAEVRIRPPGAPLPQSAQSGSAGTSVPVTPHTVVRNRELMITDIKVVESSRASDSLGPWHIRTLFANLQGGTNPDPSSLVLQWLREWETDKTVNGLLIPARPSILDQVINPWLKASGMEGKPDSQVKFAWNKAPFRLLAIVNRFDLAADPGVDGVKDAGEGRFVFGVTAPNANDESDPDGSLTQFTVIFEYKQVAADRPALDRWAREWHALGLHPSIDEGYLSALAAITDRFSADNPVLNQLRTNEIALAAPWELREFHFENGAMKSVPVKQNPDFSHNNTVLLSKFLSEGPTDAEGRPDEVPAVFQGEKFLAASSINDFTPQPLPDGPVSRPIWTAPNIQNERLHSFGINTCNGCHGVDGGMNQFEFTMVKPREKGQESLLAGFLTGEAPADQENQGAKQFADPREPWRQISFKDDLQARARILQRFADPQAATSAPGAASVPVEPPLGRKGRVH